MLLGNYHVEMKILFDVPPGTTKEQAAKMLSQGGVNVPLGLLQFIRRVDVDVKDGPAPTGTEDSGSRMKIIP